MKFGKEFASQMVPEWQEKYMDYDFLKSLLKEILLFRQSTRPMTSGPVGLTRKMTLYRAFSGLVSMPRHGTNPISPSPDLENQSILVNSVSRNGSRSYETTFLMSSDDGGEYELVYFRRLDDQFNKVDKFYRDKVKEVLMEAEVLNKQMDALIAFRIKVENPPMSGFDRTVEMTRLASDIATCTAELHISVPAEARASRRAADHMEIIEETGESSHGQSDETNEDDSEEKPLKKSNDNGKQTAVQPPKLQNMKKARLAPLDVLNRVRINKTLETPLSTIKTVLKVPQQKELKFNRENLKKVEDQLKRAFIEFYQTLRLLKNYSFLNTMAFSKIMKKYDKITSRSASKSYMEMVDNSYLGSSDEVTKLMDRVEVTFVKHFSNANRTKGMNVLRPKAKREKHRISFSTGFLAGCTFALFIALVMIIRAHGFLDQDKSQAQTQYMDNMFPLYSLFGFLVLHMIMYGINIFYWRKYRVNYSFIFGFKPGTELGYRQVFLLSFGIAMLSLLTVIGNLDMESNPITQDYNRFTESFPLTLLILLIALLFMPFNFLYRSSRFFFLKCLFHGIAAPLYKVTLPDFLLADQITSQVQALRSLEFYICYYGWGDITHRRNKCSSSGVYNAFFFVVAVIPYMSRLLQCLRRMFEEKDAMQGWNGLKYFITIVAVCLRTALLLDSKNLGWIITSWIFSIAATVAGTYWDLVYDWGLLNRKSKNRWLRDKLLVPDKKIYFIAIALNILLRFAWMQTVLDIAHIGFKLHFQAWLTVVACLEIIRRGIWNFFRLENEHLNNVGKYRAFKSVPLPFDYNEDEDNDE
ncbi:hypothetical protein LWI28_002684 [Acer negundo]|uniref:Uncharacterized protein n=1 Tax=Acer negundo TaxID=4023 RepID=A0AAD5NMN4_ACENE|nr:hypothetical protein LWI28_002684 [Acer negundo]KAK4842109.1 hypothetical protein QYF36_015855 [Acer negundo]